MQNIGSVTVNFVCQFDWTMWYAGIQPNFILAMSARVFLDEIILGQLRKSDHPPQSG